MLEESARSVSQDDSDIRKGADRYAKVANLFIGDSEKCRYTCHEGVIIQGEEYLFKNMRDILV